MSFDTCPKQKDAALQATKYLPAAAATNYSDSFDISATGWVPDAVLEIAFPASANHTDSTKSVLIVLQHSSDNSSFTNVSPLIELIVPGVTSTGSDAVTKRIRLPDGVSRYVRFAQTGPSGDGDLTGDLVTYSVCVW